VIKLALCYRGNRTDGISVGGTVPKATEEVGGEGGLKNEKKFNHSNAPEQGLRREQKK